MNIVLIKATASQVTVRLYEDDPVKAVVTKRQKNRVVLALSYMHRVRTDETPRLTRDEKKTVIKFARSEMIIEQLKLGPFEMEKLWDVVHMVRLYASYAPHRPLREVARETISQYYMVHLQGKPIEEAVTQVVTAHFAQKSNVAHKWFGDGPFLENKQKYEWTPPPPQPYPDMDPFWRMWLTNPARKLEAYNMARARGGDPND